MTVAVNARSQDGALEEGGPSSEKNRWEAWRRGRLAAALAPHGIAAAVSTVWLDDEPRRIEGLTGLWSASVGRVHPHEVEGVDSALAAGDSAALGDRLVRVVSREDALAVRVFDPAASARAALEDIDAFDWDPRWHIGGAFDPAPRSLRVQQADGGSTDFPVAGRIRFSADGREYSVLGFRVGQGLHVTFSDATNGAETSSFRFLDVELPQGHGQAQPVRLDFNRSYLPPCSFAAAYLCPLPPPENRIDLAVRAGERRQRWSSGG
ncbi:DUF1684 domain-containing protein [Leucobacter sp.]